jgi:DNA-binding Lrp family transcriptional regulator
MVLKDIERKMLSELIRNSRRSDRELAKAIGASQPTATRIRTKLEKEGYIREYTAVPDLSKAGYELLAITFIKLDPKQSLTGNELGDYKKIHYNALENNPSVVMFIKRGMGLSYDAVIISLHPDYASCDKFRTFIRQKMVGRIADMDTFLVSLEEEKNSLPFSFYTLANQLLLMPTKNGNNKEEESEKA